MEKYVPPFFEKVSLIIKLWQ